MRSFRAAIRGGGGGSSSSSSSSRHNKKTRSTSTWVALTVVVLALTSGGLLVSRESSFLNLKTLDEERGGPLLQVDDANPAVKVYVYDDPVFDHTAVIQCYRDAHGGVPPWQDERADMAQDMGEIWLHQALLSHPWRVFDPEDADVFYIPLYPVLGFKLLRDDGTCDGLTHRQRMTRSITHLVKNSVYFNRFGGADHVVVCAWWSCGKRALDPQHRMLLRRTVVGINEKVYKWVMWGCRARMVVVPYTASSTLTTTAAIGGRSAEERDIPFFFVGTGRGRPERNNLKVVEDLSANSVIDIGDDGKVWSEDASSYADKISRSRFCFCPRGDSMSSRRIFDAVSAGCIPVLTVKETRALPFLRAGLNYSEFAVVEDMDGFSTTQSVEAIVTELSSRSDAQLTTLREGLARSKSSILYGVSTGPELSDMEPFADTASMFLREVRATLGTGGVWHCAATKLDEESLAPRSSATFPMPQHERRQWLRESETIVNKEQSLLFCAPPNTGSLQFRMLAKRMQGVDHWSVSNDQPLLFDTVASELPLLDLTDTRLMEDIYTNNDSGWIKIGVVRDPVTRLLSAYLDLVRNWPSGATGWPSLDHDRRNRHRALRIDDDWEWFDAIRRHRVLKGDMTHQAQTETGNHGEARASGKGVKGVGTRGESGNAVRGLLDVAVPTAPTFEELLDLLAANIWAAPSAFRPAASLCGMWKSPFDTIIPFETLQQTSTKVLKSLPGNIWRSFGKSGWGPDGKHAFMEFDYGTAARHDVYTDEGDTGRRLSKETAEAERETWHRREAEAPGSAPPAAPPRARDMFSGDSCAWIEYYADENILKKVGHLYKADFDLFEWYKLDAWRDKLEVCLQGRT